MTPGNYPNRLRNLPYREPLGVPLYWRDEQSGELVGAMATFIYYAAGWYPTPPTADQLALVRDYLHYFIHAPCWATTGIEAEMAQLRATVAHLDSVAAINDWLYDALALDLDPL